MKWIPQVLANLSKAWLKKRKRDFYYRKAKEEQYRSRAAYKILQAVKKYDFIGSDDVVVDLGAAPGGWMQASREIVGEGGFVLGVDIREIQPLNQPNVYSIVGDIMDSDTLKRIKALLPRPANAVISDAAPNVSGVWELDHARQIELAQTSLRIAIQVLSPGGNFFVKVFQGELLDDFLKEVKTYFSSVKLIKPKASRTKSAEIYFVGLNYKGQE